MMRAREVNDKMIDESEPDLDDLYKPYRMALAAIQQGHFHEAYTAMERLLEKKLDHPQFFEVLKGLKFWMLRLDQMLTVAVGVSRAEFLKKNWKQFEMFVERYHLAAGEALEWFREGIFEKIIANYTIALEKSEYSNVEYLLEIAEKLRALKKYDKALLTLEYAQRLSPREGLVKMLLADTVHLHGDMSRGRHLFWKYFFYYENIDFEQLQTDAMWRLILLMRAEGFYNVELRLWLPVYAICEGLLPLSLLEEREALGGAQRELQERHWEATLALLKKRAHSFGENKWTRHIFQGHLLYSYMYALDLLSILYIAEAHRGQASTEDENDTDNESMIQEELADAAKKDLAERNKQKKQGGNWSDKWKQEALVLIKQFKQLSPSVYGKIGERYAHFT